MHTSSDKSSFMLQNPKQIQNTSETERASHKPFSFASPSFKFSQNSNIASLLSQITTRKQMNPKNPIFYNGINSERKAKSGYIHLKDQNSKAGFIHEIDKCIEYFEKKEDNNDIRAITTTKNPNSYSKTFEFSKNTNSDFKMKVLRDKNISLANQKEIIYEKNQVNSKARSSNSVHERGEQKNQEIFDFSNTKMISKREKTLINEINCYVAKEKEYITMIKNLENKMKILKQTLKKRKVKAKEIKCAFLKEQILKENTIGLLKNVIENAHDKDYIETMKRLMRNNNGNLLFQINFQSKIGLETKYSIFDKKSTNDEECNLNNSFDSHESFTTTMIREKKSFEGKEKSELTLLDENFY